MTTKLITQATELLEEALEYSKESSVREALRLLKEASQESNDGWIPWKGGECPVAEDVRVDIRCRNGETETHVGGAFDWSHDCCGYDIIAYRVIG